jgi:hypothetical protein
VKQVQFACALIFVVGPALLEAQQQNAPDRAERDAAEKAVAEVMAMSDEAMLALVPDKSIRSNCDCPNCFGGSQGANVFEWSVDRPDELKCRFCDTVYPNEDYPEDQTVSGQNALGETILYTYHHSTDHDVQHFLTAHASLYRRGWLLQQCEALAEAYEATGDEEYARRVVLVLDRIAQVYPHYPVIVQLQRQFEFALDQTAPLVWNGGRWGRWRPDEIPHVIPDVYATVYGSSAFEELSRERGYDVRQRFEDDFLRATIDCMKALPMRDHGNMAPYYLSRAVKIARTIGEPGDVHWAFRCMSEIVDAGSYVDGAWRECPWYHAITLGGLKSSFASLRGYSDPPGYIDDTDGVRFDDFEPEKDLLFFAKCLNGPGVLDDPLGYAAVIGDTFSHKHLFSRSPRAETVSAILPQYGHAALGRGAGDHQMQAHLRFSGSHGHDHYDNLSIALWAKGREMLSDLGYTLSQMRYWCTSTAGHNTVVVNRSDQSITSYADTGTDCDLLAYFPDVGGVSVVEAEGSRGYNVDGDGTHPDIDSVDMYRRTLVVVPVSETDAYVVDVFRVRGGSVHDWLLHGDADLDMTATSTLALSDPRKWMLEDDEEWREPNEQWDPTNPYGMMRDMAGAETVEPFTTTFRYVDQPERGVRVHMIGGPRSEVFLGRSPSVRRTGDNDGADGHKVYDFWMPQLLVRRKADSAILHPLVQTHYGFEAPQSDDDTGDGLMSLFVAVHEPFDGRPFVSSVTSADLSSRDDNAVAIRVEHNEAVDTIIATLDAPPFAERATADGVTMSGRLGIIRRREGQAPSAWLFDGERIGSGDFVLESPRAPYTGNILGATRQADGDLLDAFITEADLPSGEALRGTWMTVTHGNGYTHGYEIDHIASDGGRTLIALADDHGLRIEGNETREVYFPRRAIIGENPFVIPLAVHSAPPDAPQ